MSHSLYGIVTKTGAMRKTVTVAVPRYFEHAKLLKRIQKETKMLVHDEDECECGLGRSLGRGVRSPPNISLREELGGGERR